MDDRLHNTVWPITKATYDSLVGLIPYVKSWSRNTLWYRPAHAKFPHDRYYFYGSEEQFTDAMHRLTNPSTD